MVYIGDTISDKEQIFTFREQRSAALYIDGNYMLGLSRALNIKLDMEKLFDDLTSGFFRFRTYWYSALESSLDRNNNAYRFLDRLRYIPRTRVYVGRMTKRSQGHYESALRTDAGISLSLSMLELAKTGKVDYIFVIAGDPEYVPAIRAVQREGVLVRLLYPEGISDRQLEVHPDLLKAVDERNGLSTSHLQEFEYINEYSDYADDDDLDEIDYTEYEDEYVEEFPEDDEDDFIDEDEDDLEIIE